MTKNKGTVTCIYCGTKNKFLYEKLGDEIVETTDGMRKARTTTCKKCHKKIII
jgi:5-methylcytosine-specific restriction endonuclease McrA